MKQIIKHKWEDRSRVYFSSDWHIFHDPSWSTPIWKGRGYSSPRDAAQKIQDRINETVPENGYIYYLGDAFLNAVDEECVEWLNGIKCRNIRYIWGNHESNMHRLYKKIVVQRWGVDDIEVYPIEMNNVMFLGDYQEIKVGKVSICLSHFPIHSWNKMAHGSFMISGHQHLSDKTKRPEYPLGKCFDCGWDYKKDLWSFDEVLDVMSTKTLLNVDHHVPEK